jgi:glycosyltransferase involved in cell wall biosynthesis
VTKNILLISQSYYPYNNPCSHRIHSFAKYLPEYGFRPTILCMDCNKEYCSRIGAYSYDATLEGKDVCRTVRVPFLPSKPSKLRSEIIYLRPLSGADGLVPVWLARARELMQEERFDIVLATSGPLPSLNVAFRLSKAAGIPWVADLRDISGQHELQCPRTRPWTWRSWPYRSWEIRQETNVCRKAAAVTTVSEPLAVHLRKRRVNNVDVIYNGFDPEDYADVVRRRTGVFRIAYTGVIYGGQNVSPLCDALDLLLDEGTIRADDFEVCFFGHNVKLFEQCLRGRHCKVLAKVEGPRTRSEIQAITANASLLLQLAFVTERGLITSKVFEYLGAVRPILSVPKDNDVIDALLDETEAGKSASEPREIADIIAAHYRQWRETGNVEYHGNPEAIARYTRKAQAGKLAVILDAVFERGRSASELRCVS